ncbi:ankyrin repeat domain-containing protein 45 [Rhinophrynus dorsalis]
MEEVEISSPASTINPVMLSVLEGDVQAFQLLFDDPSDVGHERANQLLLEQDLLGRNPLFTACILGHSEVARELIKYGANINGSTSRGYLPLHCASAWGQLEVLKNLVELGADIMAVNFRGEKACEIAARYNKTECVDFLTWAEAKLALKLYINFIQQTMTDPEKIQGKLLKEEKHRAINVCKAKSDWLQQTKDPTTQDFVDQRQQLETVMQSIFTKLNTPRAESGRLLKQ